MLALATCLAIAYFWARGFHLTDREWGGLAVLVLAFFIADELLKWRRSERLREQRGIR